MEKNIQGSEEIHPVDRWRKYTIGEIKEHDLKRIESIMSITDLGEWYEMQIKEIYIDVSDQLQKAVCIGKILQRILLEYMSAAELKNRLNGEMLNVRINDGSLTENEEILRDIQQGKDNRQAQDTCRNERTGKACV